ncbi:MAG TPA: winged helix-turn-helix domain-containing protein [Candidatus Acidoferrum sp.]|nr:winged helix-turn-helix domain-containing protein [Candidatus Acidoferrum sp.]
MRQPANSVYSFGDFRLDPYERLLLHKGEPLPLTPKVFDALVLLVENAGHLVEKDEFMKRLWPETFVGDDTLAQNISLLRKVLTDGTGGPEWIVTVPRRGYRFSGVVKETVEARQNQEEEFKPLVQTSAYAMDSAKADGAEAISGQTASDQQRASSSRSTPARPFLSRFRLVAAAAIVGTLAGISTYAFLSPPMLPTVIGTTQVTHSGRVDPWGRIISDGSRLYFLEREGDHWNVAQTSLAGGETQILPAPFRNTLLLDLSPDHSEFLAASFAQKDTEMPLWIWPVQGGAPARIGDLTAYIAKWHPNGRQIVYAKNDGVYLADRDGSQVRRLTSTNGPSWGLSWSPDGKGLRFANANFSGVSYSSVWEIHADGTNLHPLFPDWSNPSVECCGSWSPDGAYFFFGSMHSGSLDIWGVREKNGFFRKQGAEPFRLTVGPSYSGPFVISPDGRRLYVFSTNLKTDFVSYNPKSRESTPFLPGTRAMFSNYSRDGQSIAYSTDGILWRMNQDGTARRAVTAPPIHATNPAWSPDGKQIVFVHHSTNCENKVYVVAADGGTPRELFPNECEQFDPAWSPDGKFIGLASAKLLRTGRFASSVIELLDVETNKLFTLPGSQGLRAPSWSPDGRFIAAMTENYSKLMLFDARSETWTELAQGTSITSTLRWSRDGAFLYFQDLLGPNEAVNRIRIRDRKREEVANFETFIRSGVPRCAFIDLAPDGSVVVALLRNHADIYALDISLP